MSRTVKIAKDLIVGKPEKPFGLSPTASAIWEQLIADLDASGLQVTAAHRGWLEMAATIAADAKAAAARVKKDGAYIEGKAGLVAHPASKRLDALRRDYIKVLTMLGLRAAVATPESQGESLDDAMNSFGLR